MELTLGMVESSADDQQVPRALQLDMEQHQVGTEPCQVGTEWHHVRMEWCRVGREWCCGSTVVGCPWCRGSCRGLSVEGSG